MCIRDRKKRNAVVVEKKLALAVEIKKRDVLANVNYTIRVKKNALTAKNVKNQWKIKKQKKIILRAKITTKNADVVLL